MQERTRQSVLLVLGLIIALLLGAWWYSGFSLEFMRFFAAEPGPTDDGKLSPSPLPAGCYYQDVQCITAPCDPIVVCPSPSQAQVECDPLTQSVKVGVAATLTATGGDGSYDWFSPGGDPGGSVAETVSYQVVYDAVGTKIVTVQAGRAGNPAVEDTMACTVTVTP
jgi:hypothetical protein